MHQEPPSESGGKKGPGILKRAEKVFPGGKYSPVPAN